jgi:hypothetical protein
MGGQASLIGQQPDIQVMPYMGEYGTFWTHLFINYQYIIKIVMAHVIATGNIAAINDHQIK